MISGQGTLGLDLVAALPDVEVVVVPVSGGGLVSGVALAVKNALPHARVIGVCADRAPAMRAALDAGRPVEVAELTTVADSLRGDLGPDNRYTFRLVRDLVDEVVLVTEVSIGDATRALLDGDGVAAEGAGAAATAYVRSEPRHFAGRTVAAIVSGAADGADA